MILREVPLDTSAISYRVADFLKDHPPFQVMEVEDLRTFALSGRVKFFEAHQFILTQGAPRFEVFVIQQGTVLLWDERDTQSRLFDVRGAGAMLGIDELSTARTFSYSARSVSDVLIYSFPTEHFEALVEKYPEAEQYVSAYRGVSGDDQHHTQDLHNALLRDLSAGSTAPTCGDDVRLRDAAQLMVESNSEVLIVLDLEKRPTGFLTARFFTEWAAGGGRGADEPIGALLNHPPVAMKGDASVADGVLAMAEANSSALALTSDGTLQGQVQGFVTARELGRIFGDRPLELLHDIRRAGSVDSLREANQRSRLFVLRYLTGGAASGWLSTLVSLVDTNIVRRLITMVSAENLSSCCWCLCGPSGRGESLTSLAPEIVVLVEDDNDEAPWRDALNQVNQRLQECYLCPAASNFDAFFHVARVSDWNRRYIDWITDPVRTEIFRSRPFFDLRPIAGDTSLWRRLETNVMSAVDQDFLHVAANDCLATIPPLTFFQNAVIDESGEETSVFRLEETALKPLVDVARVFGIAAKKVFGTSTLERFATAGRLLPQQAPIFHEASEAFRMVLWQQGRVGITQRSSGAELPPALLGAYDRQVLRTGFRAILDLLEFVDDLEWLKKL